MVLGSYVKVKVDGNYKYGVVDNLDPVTVKFDDGTKDSFCMGRVLEVSSYEYFNERCKVVRYNQEVINK